MEENIIDDRHYTFLEDDSSIRSTLKNETGRIEFTIIWDERFHPEAELIPIGKLIDAWDRVREKRKAKMALSIERIRMRMKSI